MCLNPKQLSYQLAGRTYTVCFSCGKCSECLKRKRSDYSYMMLCEADKSDSVYFLTLTYVNEHLPIAVSDPLNPNRFDIYSGDDIAALYFGSKKFRFNFDYLDCSKLKWNDDNEVFLAPSLCREDVKNCLKRSREKYFFDTGRRVKDFSYLFVSEYGKRHFRPHYHALLFNIDETFLYDYFLKDWKAHFGRPGYQEKECFFVEKANRINPEDNSDGYLKLSRYVAKYLTKTWNAETKKMTDGVRENSRIWRSQHMGEPPKEHIRFWCGASFPGINKVMQLYFSCNREKQLQALRILASFISNRSQLDYHGFKFKCPLYVKRNFIYECCERAHIKLVDSHFDPFNLPDEVYEDCWRQASEGFDPIIPKFTPKVYYSKHYTKTPLFRLVEIVQKVLYDPIYAKECGLLASSDDMGEIIKTYFSERHCTEVDRKVADFAFWNRENGFVISDRY